MKYIYFILFLIGGSLMTYGRKIRKDGGYDLRFKKPHWIYTLLGVLCWAIMLLLFGLVEG